MKLYGNPDSGHVYKVRLMLSVAGLSYDYEEVDINAPRASRSPAFQQVARFSEVPVLVDGDEALVQSNAILLHLARRLRRFGGEDERRLQRATEWLFWEANRLGMCLPQLRWKRRFAPESFGAEAEAWLQGRFDYDIKVLDRALGETGRFVVDDEVSIADFSVFGYLSMADDAAVTLPANVWRWIQDMRALPGFVEN